MTPTAALTERPVRAADLTEHDVRRALDVVLDPELDEPITDLGFVRSVEVADDRLEVHLRLPTSFCSPSFAYLMAGDSKDVLEPLAGGRRLVVELDDHHDSERINRGLAADAGWLGTYADEAEESLEHLRAVFRAKAHTAAAERCLTGMLRADATMTEEQAGVVTLADLPDDDATRALRRRREALGLPDRPDALVLVDEHGTPPAAGTVPMALRRARSTRISVDGNAHFCRGLLRTRYPGSDADQSVRGDEAFFSADSLFLRPDATGAAPTLGTTPGTTPGTTTVSSQEQSA